MAQLDKLKSAKTVPIKGTWFCLARVPNSARFFAGGSDFKVYEIDLAAAKPEPKELGKHASYVTGVALAGNHLVSGGYDGRLIWWNAQTRAQVHSVEAHKKWVRAVEATRDGKVVASVADDMVCRLWDAATGKPLHELRGHAEKTPTHFPSMLFACDFSPDGKYLATGDKVGHVVIWDVQSGKQVTALEAPGMYTWDPVARRHSIGGVRSLAFSPDGQQLAVGGIGKIGNIDHLDSKPRVEVFDWRKGTRTREYLGDGYKGLVERLVFHPKGEWLLAAGGANDGFLLFFDLKAPKALRQEKAPMHVHSAALNESADTVYAAGVGRLMTWEIKG